MTTEQPSSPSPAVPPPPPSTGGGLALGPGQIIAGIGAVLLVVSAFLNWEDVNSVTAKGTDVPLEFLVNNDANGSASILIALALAGALLVVGLLMPQLKVLALIGGALGIIVVVLYCVQVQSKLDDISTDVGLLDFIGIGTYVALAGGIAGLVGSALPRQA